MNIVYRSLLLSVALGYGLCSKADSDAITMAKLIGVGAVAVAVTCYRHQIANRIEMAGNQLDIVRSSPKGLVTAALGFTGLLALTPQENRTKVVFSIAGLALTAAGWVGLARLENRFPSEK